MTEHLTFDIKEIECFLEKKEAPGFTFTNPGRARHGIVHFTSGSTELFVEGVGNFHIEAGDTAVFCRGDKYTFYSKDGCSYITSGYLFSDECCALIATLPRVISSGPYMCDKIEHVARTWQKQLPDGYMTCKIELLSLYLEFFRASGKFDSAKYGSDIGRAVKFIHENYKRNFSSLEIANYCNISCSYLQARFKQKVGVTIVEYRDRLRFTSAKELLLSDEFSIKKAAMVLGFCDVYYFSKFFKRHSGVSPAAFIKGFGITKA